MNKNEIIEFMIKATADTSMGKSELEHLEHYSKNKG